MPDINDVSAEDVAADLAGRINGWTASNGVRYLASEDGDELAVHIIVGNESRKYVLPLQDWGVETVHGSDEE